MEYAILGLLLAVCGTGMYYAGRALSELPEDVKSLMYLHLTSK